MFSYKTCELFKNTFLILKKIVAKNELFYKLASFIGGWLFLFRRLGLTIIQFSVTKWQALWRGFLEDIGR